MVKKSKKAVVSLKPKKNMAGRKRGGASVPCPECGSNSQVIITRRGGNSVNRRRECTGRGKHSFFTDERAV